MPIVYKLMRSGPKKKWLEKKLYDFALFFIKKVMSFGIFLLHLRS